MFIQLENKYQSVIRSPIQLYMRSCGENGSCNGSGGGDNSGNSSAGGGDDDESSDNGSGKYVLHPFYATQINQKIEQTGSKGFSMGFHIEWIFERS